MRIVFVFSQRASWLGGISFYYNLFNSIKSETTSQKPTLVGFIFKGDTLPENVRNQLDEIYEIDESGLAGKAIMRISGYFSGKKSLAWLRPESSISRMARRVKADVIFLKEAPLARFRVPTVCWFPDFQFVHMPEMFPPDILGDYQKDAVNMARYATRLMLSSQSALHDFERILPQYLYKVRVVPFVAWVDDSVFRDDPGRVIQEYHLPRKFFYLPNQFWQHKNHRIVLDALELALKHDTKITIVASGGLSDFRNPSYPSEVVAEIARRGLRDHFILLGIIPHQEVYALCRASIAIIQPSLFEGWSTSIEEAKSLGKRVIASNLDVHREQNALGSMFFERHDPEELAGLLIKAYEKLTPGPDPMAEATARKNMHERAQIYRKAFMDLLTEATT